MSDCPHTYLRELSCKHGRDRTLRTLECRACGHRFVRVIKRRFYGDEAWIRKYQ